MLPPLGKQRRQDESTERDNQDHCLRLQYKLVPRKAGIAKMANAEDRRPNHRQ
ncbi:MAG: hypothetical protein WBG18_21570 [Xanthobacteraceae bacterium]